MPRVHCMGLGPFAGCPPLTCGDALEPHFSSRVGRRSTASGSGSVATPPPGGSLSEGPNLSPVVVPRESGLSTRESGPPGSDAGCMLDDLTYAVLEDSLLVRGSQMLRGRVSSDLWPCLRCPLVRFQHHEHQPDDVGASPGGGAGAVPTPLIPANPIDLGRVPRTVAEMVCSLTPVTVNLASETSLRALVKAFSRIRGAHPL
jgi:hypothetical protein